MNWMEKHAAGMRPHRQFDWLGLLNLWYRTKIAFSKFATGQTQFFARQDALPIFPMNIESTIDDSFHGSK